MNKKLKEIEEKCYEKVPMYTNGFEEVFADVFNKEKFAQLLIQECINICNQHPSKIVSNNWNGIAVAPDIIERFKENFGVE